MQILAGIMVMGATVFVLFCHAHGYPNTIDAIAFRLHRHARSMRRMHAEREITISRRWVNTLGGAE